MQPAQVVVVSVLLSAATAFGVVIAFPNASEASPAEQPQIPPPTVDPALERAVSELRERIAALESDADRRPVGVDEAVVKRAVDEWLTAHQPALDASSTDAPGEPTGPTVPSLLGKLGEAGGDPAKLQDIWAEAAQAGLLDDMVLVFEQRAKDNPGDADAQSHLGSAYLQALQHLDNPIKQGELAGKADVAFDAALAIDESHWPARFQKALSLSFWPAFLGKKAESIRQFEILVAQQEKVPVAAEHAQTYLFLGNMYAEGGRTEEAQAMWQRGLRSFPENAELQGRLTGK